MVDSDDTMGLPTICSLGVTRWIFKGISTRYPRVATFRRKCINKNLTNKNDILLIYCRHMSRRILHLEELRSKYMWIQPPLPPYRQIDGDRGQVYAGFLVHSHFPPPPIVRRAGQGRAAYSVSSESCSCSCSCLKTQD